MSRRAVIVKINEQARRLLSEAKGLDSQTRVAQLTASSRRPALADVFLGVIAPVTRGARDHGAS